MEKIDQEEIMATEIIQSAELKMKVQEALMALAARTNDYEEAMLKLEQQTVALQQARALLGLRSERPADASVLAARDANEYMELAQAEPRIVPDLQEMNNKAQEIAVLMRPFRTAGTEAKEIF